MKRAVIMIPQPNSDADEGACLFEVYSPTGSFRSVLRHDVCPEVPPGEDWGSENLAERWDPQGIEAAIAAAFPGSKVLEWRERLVLGTCPALASARQRLEEARQRVEEARQRVEAALQQQGEAERLFTGDVRVVELPRIADAETRAIVESVHGKLFGDEA